MSHRRVQPKHDQYRKWVVVQANDDRPDEVLFSHNEAMVCISWMAQKFPLMSVYEAAMKGMMVMCYKRNFEVIKGGVKCDCGGTFKKVLDWVGFYLRCSKCCKTKELPE